MRPRSGDAVARGRGRARRVLLALARRCSWRRPRRRRHPLRLDNHLSLRTPVRLRARPTSATCRRSTPPTAPTSAAAPRARTPPSTPGRWRTGAFRRASLLDAVRRAYPRLPRHRQRRRLGRRGHRGRRPGSPVHPGRDPASATAACATCCSTRPTPAASWRVVSLPFTRRAARRTGATTAPAPPSTSPAGTSAASRRSSPSGGRSADWPGYRACRMALYVVQPRFEGDRLVLPEPVPVTDRGLGADPGGRRRLVRRDRRAPPPTSSGPRSRPPDARARRSSSPPTTRPPGTLGAAAGRSPRRAPLNDDHCTPGIVADCQGGLHVVSGSHNTSFMYTHTVDPGRPDDVEPARSRCCSTGYRHAGQTRRRPRPPDLRLAGLHARRTRWWSSSASGAAASTPPSTASPTGALRAAAGSREAPGATPQRIVYCSRYTRLRAVLPEDDHRPSRAHLPLAQLLPPARLAGRDQRAANRYHHRMILISEDGGDTWRFATLADFPEACCAALSGRGGGSPGGRRTAPQLSGRRRPGGGGPATGSGRAPRRGRARSRSATQTPTPSSSRASTVAPRVDDHAVAEALAPRQMLAHLVRGDDEAAVLDGAGAQQHLPVRRARVRGERRRHAEDLRAAQRQGACRGRGSAGRSRWRGRGGRACRPPPSMSAVTTSAPGATSSDSS